MAKNPKIAWLLSAAVAAITSTQAMAQDVVMRRPIQTKPPHVADWVAGGYTVAQQIPSSPTPSPTPAQTPTPAPAPTPTPSASIESPFRHVMADDSTGAHLQYATYYQPVSSPFVERQSLLSLASDQDAGGAAQGAIGTVTDQLGFDPSNMCGDFILKRPVQCRWLDSGQVTSDSTCTTPKPDTSKRMTFTGGCNYAWNVGQFLDPGPSCSAAKAETRSVVCMRTNDNILVPDSQCAGEKPNTVTTVVDYATCTYSWLSGAFVDPGATCSAAKIETRPVSCIRELDGAKSTDAMCDPATKPATTQSVADYATCTYDWISGEFQDPGAACTASETQTRTVECHRALDGAKVADALCQAAKPSLTQVVNDFRSCTYAATGWSAWDIASTCSANASETRTAKCERSDHTIVDGSECTSRGIALSETQTIANYVGCSNSWAVDGFVDPGASCTASEIQTRDVWCKRDLDGTKLPDASCTAATKPSLTQAVADFSGCSYSWKPGDWGDWSSTCSATASRSRPISCLRSDGTTMDATDPTQAACVASAGVRPPTTDVEAVYTGCSYTWGTVSWGAIAPACGSTSQSGAVACMRSDGTPVADSFCPPASKPSLTKAATDYSTCTFSAVNPTVSSSSTCSSTATQTTSYQCKRSDGTIMPDATSCAAAGIATTVTATVPNYSTCSYSWSAGAYVDPGASCTSSEIQTRAVSCQRDLDGAVVADALCNAATKPGLTQSVADYSGCSYSAVNPSVAWSSTCSPSATQTTTYQCKRSDGTIMPDVSQCTAHGVATTATATASNFSTCSYSWQTGAYVDPGASCTAAEVQTRPVWCQRSGDNATVADSYCTLAKPATTQSVADYSGCSYSAVNGSGSWNSSCSTNATYTTVYQCKRSDGTIMPDVSQCTAHGVATTTASSGSNLSGCTYNPSLTAQGTCSSGVQTETVTCTRSDGVAVAASYCGYGSSSVQQNCTSYAWAVGAYSAQQAVCTTGTQTRSVVCQQNYGGTITNTADNYCSATVAKPATAQGYSNTSACTYYWNMGGWSDWNSHCSGSAVSTRGGTCMRSDGSSQAGSVCTGAGVAEPATSQTAAVYDQCTYYGGPWWGDWTWNTTCSANAVETEHRTCYRSDGTAMSTGDPCVNSGVPVSQSVTTANYSGCGYAAVNWGGYSACSGGSQTRYAQCQRSDGTIVASTECTNRGIAVSQSQSCSVCPNPANLYARNVYGYYCTGNWRQMTNAEATEYWQTDKYNAALFLQKHASTVSCVAEADAEPSGNSQADSDETYLIVSDGGAAPIPANGAYTFHPYGDLQPSSGSLDHTGFTVDGACVGK